MIRFCLPACVAVCCACSAEPLPAGHYRILTGQETDTYTREPVPVTYKVTAYSSTDSNAAATEVATSDQPITSIEVPATGSNWYTLTAEDADGERRIQATSFAISGITVAGYEYPLFAGRTDVFCRPPSAFLTAQGDHPPVGLVWGRYLWAVGGSSDTSLATDSYDLIAWNESSPQTSDNSFSELKCPERPCKFESFATYSYYDSTTVYQFGLGIGADWAISLNVYDGTSQDVNLPDELASWADIAGGKTFTSDAGAVYVVGATRSTAKSTAVLEISTSTGSNIEVRSLNGARTGAAATYLENVGLVVIGGNATEPGVEILAPAGDTFTKLTYPADEVQGAALVAANSLNSNIVWRIGGRKADGTAAPSVAYDLACVQDCTPKELPDLDLDVPVANGFFYHDKRIVVGEQADGTMIAWRVTDTATEIIPQRQPRRAATAVQLPNGFIALVGGTLLVDGSDAGNGGDALSLELVAL
jgi:hypothetical protein